MDALDLFIREKKARNHPVPCLFYWGFRRILLLSTVSKTRLAFQGLATAGDRIPTHFCGQRIKSVWERAARARSIFLHNASATGRIPFERGYRPWPSFVSPAFRLAIRKRSIPRTQRTASHAGR